MKPFKYTDAHSLNEAVALSRRSPGKVKMVAGGTDLLGELKDRVLVPYPEAVVNLKTIPDLDTIKEESGGLTIGALAKLCQIETSPSVKGKYDLLAQAAHSVGSPQIRNMGTIGGNLCQDSRCWYYRASPSCGAPFICLKKGGRLCHAVRGENRYHSIFGGPKGCFAVHPSDTAPALIALKAVAKTTKRTVVLDHFFDALKGTILDADEILAEIEIPSPVEGTKSIYLKSRERKAIDFAIVSVACVVVSEGPVCKDARILLGGVAPIPWRSEAAENAVKGKVLNESTAEEAGRAAIMKAMALSENRYKVKIAETLVKRALLACK